MRMSEKFRTLRFRLAAWYAVVGILLLAGFSAALYFYVSGTMARPLDHELRQDLAAVRSRLVVQPDGELQWEGTKMSDTAPWDAGNPWFELWDEQGRLVRRFWPLADSSLKQLPVAPVRDRETLSVFYVADEVRLRVLSVPFPVPGRSETWMIRVMRIHQPAAGALGALRLIILIALPVVIALLVAGGYVLTRRWLKPLDDMVAAADRITADDLGRRLPVTNPQDELGRLAAVFNVTLGRLEDSFTALDRFVADASHELRTPLTTLRSVGEVGLRGERTPAEYRETIGSMLEEAHRLQLLVQRLLELASTESGAPPLNREPIRIDEYVTRCVEELGILAEMRQQRIVLGLVPCKTATDPVIFRQAFQNILDNAIKFSPDGSTIAVTVREDEGSCQVAVRDQGPGISPEYQARITERFFRPESALGRGRRGFGLGLAITKAYMHLLGGTLSHEPVAPHGSMFKLTLPKL